MFESDDSKFVVGFAEIKISSELEGYNFGGNFESIDQKKGNSGESWLILDLNPFSNIVKQTTGILSGLWFIGILLTIVFAITSFIIGKRTAKPLKELIIQTKHITKGDYNLDIVTNRKDEIGELATSYNQMKIYLKESTTSILNLNAANQQLAASEQLFKAEKEFSENLLETANSFIVVLDVNANIILFNKYAEKLTEYKKEEVLGKNWFNLF